MTTPWKNGFWYNKDFSTQYYMVNGEKSELYNLISLDYPDSKPMLTDPWKYGDFGPAKAEVAEVTGIKNYNIEIPSFFGRMPAVLNDKGDKAYFYGFTKAINVIEWLSTESIEKLKEDRDSADAPTCSYFEQKPDAARRIIWLSGILAILLIFEALSVHIFLQILSFVGPPGAGKSTSGQLLGRNHGYVYYEADCFGMFANPFVDPNVDEPTLQIAKQKPLKVSNCK